MDNSTMASLW